MAVPVKRRVFGMVGTAVGVLALLPASPAQAELSPGTEVRPIAPVVAVICSPSGQGSNVSVIQTINGVTVYASAQCTALAARTAGEYSVAGVTSPTQLRFEAACANSGGTGVTNGFVDVPPGTIVDGVPVATTTSITGTNVAVIFPNGRTAIVNQVIASSTTIRRNAIAFTGGPIVGQVVCGRSS